MAGISISLGSFHFRRPTWKVQGPVGDYDAREHVTPTDEGFHFSPLPRNPSRWVITAQYVPQFKPSIEVPDPFNPVGGTVTTTTRWDEDSGNTHGLQSLLALLGTVQEFRWGGLNIGDYYIKHIRIAQQGTHPNTNQNEGSDAPITLLVTINLTEASMD